jgi:hypothetical protein
MLDDHGIVAGIRIRERGEETRECFGRCRRGDGDVELLPVPSG